MCNSGSTSRVLCMCAHQQYLAVRLDKLQQCVPSVMEWIHNTLVFGLSPQISFGSNSLSFVKALLFSTGVRFDDLGRVGGQSDAVEFLGHTTPSRLIWYGVVYQYLQAVLRCFPRLYMITESESGTLGVNLSVVSKHVSHPVLQQLIPQLFLPVEGLRNAIISTGIKLRKLSVNCRPENL